MGRDRILQANPSPLGAKWHPRTVLNILRNLIYMGVTYFNRRQRVHISGKRHTYVDRPQSEWAVIDGATPAIVDADLFRAVQARLDQPLVRPVPPHTRYFAFGLHPLLMRRTHIGARTPEERRLSLLPLHAYPSAGESAEAV